VAKRQAAGRAVTNRPARSPERGPDSPLNNCAASRDADAETMDQDGGCQFTEIFLHFSTLLLTF